MDEAFTPIAETILALVNQAPVVGGDEWGQRVSMTAIDVELPIQLDIGWQDEVLRIGSTPPLYGIRTSILPSFHRMRVRASLSEESQGG